jgi:hypothetical protein
MRSKSQPAVVMQSLQVAADSPASHMPSKSQPDAAQSAQLELSPASHTPSPSQPPVDSVVHDEEQPSPDMVSPSSHCSPGSSTPLPQAGPQVPQSSGQLVHSSPPSQTPLPQVPQSIEHDEGVSPHAHVPSPQVGAQSDGQLSAVSSSLASHAPLPQVPGQSVSSCPSGQSSRHVEQSSGVSHEPLHEDVQSWGHERSDSPPEQSPSPQFPPGGVPASLHAATTTNNIKYLRMLHPSSRLEWPA